MTPWYMVYRRLATLFSSFLVVHSSSSGEEIYKKCMTDPEFVQLNSWVKRFLGNGEGESFDPIHLFASFNDTKLNRQTRIDRINRLFKILEAEEHFEEIDFDGCPTPVMIKIMARRPVHVQQEIWSLFELVMQQGKDALKELDTLLLDNWYGINLSSFTIFLFWIDHINFLPLDGNTVDYLTRSNLIDRKPRNFDDYVQLLERSDLKDHLSISFAAVEFRGHEKLSPSKIHTTKKTEKPLSRLLPVDDGEKKTATTDTQMPIPAGCRLLGLRVYEPTPDKWVKVLTRGKMYGLYSAFGFDNRVLAFNYSNDSMISYDEFRDCNLYDLENFSVNISAIVGENGSGKSTLTELMYIAVNNLAKRDPEKGKEIHYLSGICMDLYFFTDGLYKLTIELEKVSVVRYQRKANLYCEPLPVSITNFHLEQLFYTISINYSLYALNSVKSGKWIEALFDKNDQYQVPIVINPYRKSGNINVNRENKLVLTRLLSTLLMPIEDQDLAERPENIRKLTGDRYAEALDINIDKEKLKILYVKGERSEGVKFQDATPYWNDLLIGIKETFKIVEAHPFAPPTRPRNYIEAAFMYLVKKVINICMNYPGYRHYFDVDNNRFKVKNIKTVIQALERDKTHVTHKFYQTIHFLRETHLQELKDLKDLAGHRYTISSLAFAIDRVRSNLSENQFKTVHFIPPSFLQTDIILTGEVPLDELSSGEKQRIFSVSSLGYHLINLDSNVDQAELYHYPYVNVMFDEIELYFHPEMQRSFIRYLLDYLSDLEVETRFQINILFVTHSPFILSDIPSDNILFLGKQMPPGVKTFGANIHTLLAESFFLQDSFMGDFARSKINDLINYLIGDKHELKWNENSAAQLISLIGEPLIRDRLVEVYREKFQTQGTVQEKIQALENEIKLLRYEAN